MQKRRTIVLLSALLATSLFSAPARAFDTSARNFQAEGNHFSLDGKPFRIISGELHYARIPRAYWRDRLKKAKAMGLNTISTYVFWNQHEAKPGVYDFTGENDVAEFIREAQQEGLYVILRPGPYSCAEWELGGYPSWLFKDRDIVLRSSDPKFMTAAQRWIKRMGQELAPLQIGNGGPIIAVQVENEYGSFDKDHAYMEQIRQMLRGAGFTKAMLYTADGADVLANGVLPDLPSAINFGQGDAKRSFDLLAKFRPDGPKMAGEYWAGWFDHWGEKHQKTDAQKQEEELAWMLAQGYSVNFYMVHGGTSFGWMNGANVNDGKYQPDVTSYDYDAPLDESGKPTEKYYAFRDIITKATGEKPAAIPETPAAMTVPNITFERATSLWKNLPKPISSKEILSMEDIGQAYGYILYRTKLDNTGEGELVLDELHDYAQIYLDGALVGTLDRRLNQTQLKISLKQRGQQLDILVENSGRVNFTKAIRGERTGITKQVLFSGHPVEGWEIYALPMENVEILRYTNSPCSGPCFYQTSFSLEKVADTFLDTRQLGKGMVWINGRPLGRVWDIGPQNTLYLPAPWLRKGKNTIEVFDLKGKTGLTVKGLDQPILDGPIKNE